MIIVVINRCKDGVQMIYFPLFSVQAIPRGDHILNFSAAEDVIHDEDLK